MATNTTDRAAKFCKEARAEIHRLNCELDLANYLLCEARGGHYWQNQEQNETFNLPWQKCLVCGSGRTVPAELRRTELRLVQQ